MRCGFVRLFAGPESVHAAAHPTREDVRQAGRRSSVRDSSGHHGETIRGVEHDSNRVVTAATIEKRVEVACPLTPRENGAHDRRLAGFVAAADGIATAVVVRSRRVVYDLLIKDGLSTAGIRGSRRIAVRDAACVAVGSLASAQATRSSTQPTCTSRPASSTFIRMRTMARVRVAGSATKIPSAGRHRTCHPGHHHRGRQLGRAIAVADRGATRARCKRTASG